jgi:4-hydroxybenzoate polyprenyltransferase
MKTLDHPAKAKQHSRWHLVKQFVHLRRFAFTVFLPLMGAATAEGNASWIQLLLIIATSSQFHLFTYVLNDVIDLPVDRIMPKRASHPLVRGEITLGAALVIALIQVPLVLLAAWLGGVPWNGMAALTAAMLCMAIYDIWGKRNAFPPVTDLIQALAWGCLTLYGAWVVASPSVLTYVLAAIFVVFILLMNGVFEGVIDIEEDSRAGLSTTAMVFGVRPRGEARLPFIPTSLLIYCLVLEAVLSVLNLISLAWNVFGYSSPLRAILLLLVIVLNIAIVWLSVRLIIPSERLRKRIRDEHIDLMSVFSILILLVSYFPSLEPQFIGAILLCTILPMIL